MKCLFSYFLLIVLLVSGCSQLPEVQTDIDPAPYWLEHQLAVNQIYSWDINGRVGIKTDKQNGTATLYWHQFGSNYELRIIAPLGQGTYILRGSPAGVVMQGPDGKVYSANRPEELMQAGLGWSVNLDGLQYWVRGIPKPDTSYSELSLDKKGRLNYLTQSGFSIEVQRYTDLEQVSLPEKLMIKSDDLQLKMIIQNWEL